MAIRRHPCLHGISISIYDDGKERSTFSAGTSKTVECNEDQVLALRRESPESLAEKCLVQASFFSGCGRHRDNSISLIGIILGNTID